MKTIPHAPFQKPLLTQELRNLRRRLTESENTIEAIQKGEVDSVLIQGKDGARVFTLEGEEHAYRMLIESMNQGALMLTTDGVILYANRYFSNLIHRAPAQMMGTRFLPLIISKDQSLFRRIIKAQKMPKSSIQISLNAQRKSQIPVQISFCNLPKNKSFPRRIGIVISEMTEIHQSKEGLRALTHRTINTHEKIKSGVSFELHNRITQLLCAIQFRSHALSQHIALKNRPLQKEATKLRLMIGKAVNEVQDISQKLSSSTLDHLGLAAVIRDSCQQFENKTGIPVQLICAGLTKRLPPEIELTLYRIFQEALKNVQQHSSALNVIVHLRRHGRCVHLSIHDNGVGVNLKKTTRRIPPHHGLGVLSMNERALSSGGGFDIQFTHRQGTKIEVRIPLPPQRRSKKKPLKTVNPKEDL